MSQHDPLLRLRDVESLCGFGKSFIYQQIQAGKFPPPVRIGERSVRWRQSAVVEWIAIQEAA